MIDTVDREILAWIGDLLPNTPLQLAPPSADRDETGVDLHLLGFGPAPTAQHDRGKVLVVTLRYLVTAGAKSPEDAHRLLGQLLFAALAHETYDVDLEGIGVETWLAFGIPPRPAFVLEAPLIVDRSRSLPRVTHRPVVRPRPAIPFAGQLLGPGDLPLSRARVTLTELGLHTSTDDDGRFRFGAIAPTPRTKRLRIQAKGLEFETETELPSDGRFEPVIIRVAAMEV